jgi:hypothetical protein
MGEGAFALIDCLGFKGMWNRGISAEQLVAFLDEAKKAAEESPTSVVVDEFATETIDIRHAFISDTIAISVRAKTTTPLNDVARGYLVLLAANACAHLARQFVLRGPIPLLLRGCVTYGLHTVKDTFLLGPAVDEAASLAGTAQGAFVWLTPVASRLRRQYVQGYPQMARSGHEKQGVDKLVEMLERLVSVLRRSEPQLGTFDPKRTVAFWSKLTPIQKQKIAPIALEALATYWRADDVLPDYPVPMKGGGVLAADTVNPLFYVGVGEHDIVRARTDASFTAATLDVMLKQQNTNRFVYAASQHSQRQQQQLSAPIAQLNAQVKALIGVPM